jgi:hypothetical protein
LIAFNVKANREILRFETLFKEKTMFQSRWGYHPCDHRTYRKLKFLNQVYLQAMRLAHAWERWKRKDPHNRVIRRRIRNDKGQTIGYEPTVSRPEPRICPVFSQKVFERCHVDKKGIVSREGFMEEKVVTTDFGIPADYSSAKTPVSDHSRVRPLLQTLPELDELYEKTRHWLEDQDVR